MERNLKTISEFCLYLNYTVYFCINTLDRNSLKKQSLYKKDGATILISEKIHFRAKKILPGIKIIYHNLKIMISGKAYQGDITILNASTGRASEYIKQKPIELQGEIDKFSYNWLFQYLSLNNR